MHKLSKVMKKFKQPPLGVIGISPDWASEEATACANYEDFEDEIQLISVTLD